MAIISYEDGATVDPCANALHAMARAQFQEGETVCVYGAGPIGLFAVQYAKIKKAGKIIAVDIWDEKLSALGGVIIRMRMEYTRRLQKEAEDIYKGIMF